MRWITLLIATISIVVLATMLSAPIAEPLVEPSSAHAETITVSPPETVPAPAVLVPPEPARIPPIPMCAWGDTSSRSLVAMIRIESSSGKDAAAIAWTMARRWLGIARFRGRSFAQYIVDTSAPLRAHRAGRVASLTTYQACVLGVGDRCDRFHGEEKDRALTAFLEKWAYGDVPDPCGGHSFQWFAPWHRPSRRFERVDCGDTANVFRRLPEVSHERARARYFEPVNPLTCR